VGGRKRKLVELNDDDSFGLEIDCFGLKFTFATCKSVKLGISGKPLTPTAGNPEVLQGKPLTTKRLEKTQAATNLNAQFLVYPLL
jgi:hypothetical protein